MALKGIEQSNEMLHLMMGFTPSRSLYVMAKLGIADLLRGGSKTADELAEKTHVHSDSLYRILRLISGLGVVEENEEKGFSLTPLGETLCSDTENSVRDYYIMYHEIIYNKYQYLLDSVMTGNPVAEKVHEMPIFEFLGQDQEARATFIAGLANQSRLDNAAILESYDFRKSLVIADIGGGSGALLSAILNVGEHLKGILFDLESTIDSVRAANRLPKEKCQLISGDFFDDITIQADTFIMKQVLHDWNDEECVSILRNCCQTMNGQAKLLIIERLIGAAGQTVLTHNLDITMMTVPGGRERSEQEYANLLDQSGMKISRTIPMGLEMNILEAVPV